jgi:hypothetical protein
MKLIRRSPRDVQIRPNYECAVAILPTREPGVRRVCEHERLDYGGFVLLSAGFPILSDGRSRQSLPPTVDSARYHTCKAVWKKMSGQAAGTDRRSVDSKRQKRCICRYFVARSAGLEPATF